MKRNKPGFGKQHRNTWENVFNALPMEKWKKPSNELIFGILIGNMFGNNN